MLVADAIGVAETRLFRRDDNVHYALKRFRLIRLDDAEKESGNRPHHGLALYVKEYIQIYNAIIQNKREIDRVNNYELYIATAIIKHKSVGRIKTALRFWFNATR